MLEVKAVTYRTIGSFLFIFLSGCNFWGWMDIPRGNAQLLSAARGCLDEGDFGCALRYYRKLPDSMIEVRNSEQAFTILAQYGITVDIWLDAYLNTEGSAGPVNYFANLLIDKAGESARSDLYDAWKLGFDIPSGTDTGDYRNLTRFITATVLYSEILAEQAGNDGDAALFQDTDLNSDPSCVPTPVSCTLTCTLLGAFNTAAGASLDVTVKDDFVSNTLTANHYYVILEELSNALNDLGSGDGIGETASDFSGAFSFTSQPTLAAEAAEFSCQMLDSGVGAE